MQIPGQMFQAVYIFYCRSKSFLFLLVSYSTPLKPIPIIINSFYCKYPPSVHTSPSPRPPQNKERSNRKNHKPPVPKEWVAFSACRALIGAKEPGTKSASGNGRIICSTRNDTIKNSGIDTETRGRMVRR